MVKCRSFFPFSGCLHLPDFVLIVGTHIIYYFESENDLGYVPKRGIEEIQST